MKYLLTLILVASYSYGLNTRPTILDYYNQYNQYVISRDYHKYNFSMLTNSYYIKGGLYDIPVILDFKNGFIEFTDEGTGGGTFIFQMALFTTKANEIYILINNREFDAFFWHNKLFCYKVINNKWVNVYDKILPKIPLSYFFNSEYYYIHNNDINQYIIQHNYNDKLYSYELPRYGTDLKTRLALKYYMETRRKFGDYHKLTSEEKAKIEMIQSNITNEDCILYWNKEIGKFELK